MDWCNFSREYCNHHCFTAQCRTQQSASVNEVLNILIEVKHLESRFSRTIPVSGTTSQASYATRRFCSHGDRSVPNRMTIGVGYELLGLYKRSRCIVYVLQIVLYWTKLPLQGSGANVPRTWSRDNVCNFHKPGCTCIAAIRVCYPFVIVDVSSACHGEAAVRRTCVVMSWRCRLLYALT